MKLPQPLLPARFSKRLTRFSALVEWEGSEALAYLPNSGRMQELLLPGRQVFLSPKTASNRKTAFDLVLVRHTLVLVSVDSRVPSAVLGEALAQGALEPFQRYHHIRREVPFGESRLDFALRTATQQCYLEVKSVTLVRDGCGLFPDAPTERGARHLRSLVRAVREGHEAAVIFMIQRQDGVRFAPNDGTDPVFGAALREAVAGGVQAYAFRCRVSLEEIVITQQVPLHL